MWSFEKCCLVWFGIGLFYVDPSSTTAGHSGSSDMNKFMDDYVNEVKSTLRLGEEYHSIHKRSLSNVDLDQLQGVDLLAGFQEEFTLPARFPNDLVLFSLCYSDTQTWFAVAIEANLISPQSSRANDLVLYKYQDGLWAEVDRERVVAASRLATEQIGDLVYIIVAEYHAYKDKSSAVYSVDSATNRLQFVHMFGVNFASDVVIWTWEGLYTFAAIAVAENTPGSEKRYSTQSPVYRWLGNHFDMIDSLPTHNPRALAHFTIHSTMFVAVANFQDDLGNTRVSSDIFRYDVASGNFHLYQKLPTEAAVDVEYMCISTHQTTEHFLVYASAYHKDEEGNVDYSPHSVVYKLSDQKYFVPFQALQVPRLTGWQTVRYVKDDVESLILLGVSEEGIKSFQYDGWRFVPTGVYYEKSAFGPGVKSLRAFYYGNQTFISVANKQSVGYETNVFSPVVKRHVLVEEMKQTIASWMQRMTRELEEGKAKMADLLRIARSSPSVNDTILHLGSEVIFHDVEIDHLQTLSTRVGDEDMSIQVKNHLYTINTEIERIREQLAFLKETIDGTSFHTRNVYEDIFERTADIACTHSCHVHGLEVENLNGEDLQSFLRNVININEPIKFEEETTFDHLAVTDPLNTSRINGHPVDSIIDWTKEVNLPNGIKVDGDVILHGDLNIRGTLDGVAVNVAYMEEEAEDAVIKSSTEFIETLNTSQLLLSDGKLSQVDFARFSQQTLKIRGDQIISEVQDFERIEADEVETQWGLYRAPPMVYPSQPRGASQPDGAGEDTICNHPSHQEAVLGAQSSNHLESNSLMDEEIIIPHDFMIHGSVTVENGSLVAGDVIDQKHKVSAKKVMEFGLPLNEAVISNHFKFNSTFKTPNLTVDTLNGINISSLVDPDSAESEVVTARKDFRGDLVVDGTADVTGVVSGVNLTQLGDSACKAGELKVNNLTVHSIDSSTVEINGHDWRQLVLTREDGKLYVRSLQVEEDLTVDRVMVRGHINKFHLESLLEDTVYDDGKTYSVTGKKHFENGLKISDMALTTLNDLDFKSFSYEDFWKKRFSQAKVVKVESLFYTDHLDSVKADEFGEWLLTEGDQTVSAIQDMNHVELQHLLVPPEGSINSINIQRLLADAVFLSDNSTFDHIVFEDEVTASRVVVGEMLSGLRVPEELVVSDTDTLQQVTAHKHIHGSVTVRGRLRPAGPMSGLDLTSFCRAIVLNNTTLNIFGNASFKEEPSISDSINNKKWTDLMDRVWLTDDDLNIPGHLLIRNAQFGNLDVDTVNNVNLEKSLSQLVSLTKDEVVNGSFFFSRVEVQGGFEGEEAHAGGRVQGLDLESFVRDVLLDKEDQEICCYPDFNILIVDGLLRSDGLLNGFNLASDVLLTDVPVNVMTSSLTLDNLTVSQLTLPAGAELAGVNLTHWNLTAANKSAAVFITGNIVFTGDVDSANGIRVEGLMNGVHFDADHLLLSDRPQKVSGVKIFSPHSTVDIEELRIKGYLNGINITDFYNQQVINEGNWTIGGHKKFRSPMYTDTLVLPQMYRGYNLSWLEEVLASPLRTKYFSQLQAIQDFRLHMLTGRRQSMQSLTRVRDVEGTVLSLCPLSSANANDTVLAAIRRQGNRTTLTLLHWSIKFNMFLDMPGSVRKVLTSDPTAVESVAMPGGELAAFVTSHTVKNGELFRLLRDRISTTRVPDGQPGSSLLSFLSTEGHTCFVVVGLREMCLVYCTSGLGRRLRLPPFPCPSVTEAALMETGGSIFIVGLQTGPNNSAVVVWKMSGNRFTQVTSEPQYNPVSIAATTSCGPYVAVVSRHRKGSSRREVIRIYRFDVNTHELLLEQSLPSIFPKKVLFAHLPSNESALYVLSDYPVSPLQVFVYRGILGYQPLRVNMTLPTPSDIHAFTDHQQRHFVVITSQQKSFVFKANFS